MLSNLSREHIRVVFEDPETHPVCIHLVLSTSFGIEYLFWEPETLVAEIRATFNTGHSKSFFNKCEAVRTALRSRRAYTEWEVFLPVVTGLTGAFPSFDFIVVPTPIEAVVGTNILKMLSPSADLSDEVISTIAACLADDGVVLCSGLPSNISDRVDEKLQKLVGIDPQKKTKFSIQTGNKTPETSLWLYKLGLIDNAVQQDRKYLVAQAKKLGLEI